MIKFLNTNYIGSKVGSSYQNNGTYPVTYTPATYTFIMYDIIVKLHNLGHPCVIPLTENCF